jgi:hypothetical protein
MSPGSLRPPSVAESGDVLAPVSPTPSRWPTAFDEPPTVERAWVDLVARRPEGERPGLLRALEFARERHGEQHRRGSATPYWVHPVRVAIELVRWGEDPPPALQAALLHDVVEDTDTTVAEVRDAFGDEVAGLVDWLTAPPGGRQGEVRAYYERLRRSAPPGAQVLKLADRVDNLRSIQALVMRTGNRHRLWAGAYLERTRWQVLPLAAEAPSVARVALVTAMADLAPLVAAGTFTEP